ncbi:MAG: NAD-dependent succinate-semialdehyde dehydrogenase [Acidimicrobiia bacterium]
MLRSVDPATGECFATYDAHDDAAVAAAVDQADAAFHRWRRTGFTARAEVLEAVAVQLELRRDELADLMAREMGKPLADGRAELAKCATACRFYAGAAADQLADRPVATEHPDSFVHCEPLGVVLAIMPWNFPFWQVFRFAAPTLMAGNVGLLKHASNVSGCALAIEQLFADAGLPDGAWRSLLLASDRIGDLIDHELVRAVTLTGSGPAGRAVAARAGRALKKSVLELGGSDAYLVLDDADLDLAAEVCARSRLLNSGQSCISAKRFIVDASVHDEFVDRFAAELGRAVPGDPRAPDTTMGPLARIDLRDEVHDQVRRSVDKGARLVLGGSVPEGPGAFYPPTLLVEVQPGMAAADEEVFGPVAAVLRADDEDHAVRLANDTPFGLGAAVFTRDLARGRRLAAVELEAGSCFVNALVASDPRLPFGGIKESGYGRELAELGIRSFVNEKTVVVAG